MCVFYGLHSLRHRFQNNNIPTEIYFTTNFLDFESDKFRSTFLLKRMKHAYTVYDEYDHALLINSELLAVSISVSPSSKYYLITIPYRSRGLVIKNLFFILYFANIIIKTMNNKTLISFTRKFLSKKIKTIEKNQSDGAFIRAAYTVNGLRKNAILTYGSLLPFGVYEKADILFKKKYYYLITILVMLNLL